MRRGVVCVVFSFSLSNSDRRWEWERRREKGSRNIMFSNSLVRHIELRRHCVNWFFFILFLLCLLQTSNTIRALMWRPSSSRRLPRALTQHLSSAVHFFFFLRWWTFFARQRRLPKNIKKNWCQQSSSCDNKRLLNKDFSLSSHQISSVGFRMSLGRHTSQTCRTSQKWLCVYNFFSSSHLISNRHTLVSLSALRPEQIDIKWKMFRKRPLDGAKLTSWTAAAREWPVESWGVTNQSWSDESKRKVK